jgi:hypothetical protein
MTMLRDPFVSNDSPARPMRTHLTPPAIALTNGSESMGRRN